MNNAFPPGIRSDALARPVHGWQTLMLPFIEESDLYERIRLDLPWNDPRNAQAFRESVYAYTYPGGKNPAKSEHGYALSHYAGNSRVLGTTRSHSQDDIRDGSSNTMLAGEAIGNLRPWGDPFNHRDPSLGINRTPEGFGSLSPGGANFLMGDGSVRFLKDSVSPQVLRALGTPAGGERINRDSY